MFIVHVFKKKKYCKFGGKFEQLEMEGEKSFLVEVLLKW